MKLNKYTNLLVVAALTFSLISGCKTGDGSSVKGSFPKAWINSAETEGLENVKDVDVYVDGLEYKNPDIDSSKDVKKIYKADKVQRVFDYTTGFKAEMSADLKPDYSMAAYVTKYSSDNLTVVISKETTQKYTTIDDYYSDTLSEAISKVEYMEACSTTYTEAQRTRFVGNYIVDIFRSSISDMPDTAKAFYSYVYFRTEDSKDIYRFMLKYTSSVNSRELEEAIIQSFGIIPASGNAVCTADYKNPVIPEYWNDETEAFYKNLCESDTVKWGIFRTTMEAVGMDWTNYYESVNDTKLDLVLHYLGTNRLTLNQSFVNEIYSQNKVLVLTLRWEATNGYTPVYNVLRGKLDNELRNLAVQLKSVRHPIILRMENEYNSDWTQSCGVKTMCDPELYRDCWIKFYDICLEEGVDNAIFMSNPQSDDDFPEQKWNYFVNYLPSKYYIQIAGLTYYNHGTTVIATKKSFKELYTKVAERTNVFFSNWPWIIGEFGCAGPKEGVDKVDWINGMFESMNLFPNIKGALWFDSYDNDADGFALRDFRLTSPAGALTAFMDGVKKSKESSKTQQWKNWDLK